jgi:hypothetical protein
MTVKEEFVAVPNKELLWNILFENNVFAGLPSEKYDEVQRVFETAVHSRAETITSGASLVEANKELIADMVGQVERMRLPVGKAPANSIQLFDAKKAELESAMRPPAPEEISFADEADEPLDEKKLDSLLEDTMRQRKLDMEAAMTGGEHSLKTNKKVAWADQQAENGAIPISDHTALPAALSRKLKPAPGSAPEKGNEPRGGDPLAARVAALEAKLEALTGEVRGLASRVPSHP